MKTITINLYSFDELTKEAQQKVLLNLNNINTDYNWWDFTYEDAGRIGLQIDSFELDTNKIECSFDLAPLECANEIIKEHGEDTDTYKLAKTFIELIETTALEEGLDFVDDETEFLENLSGCYLKMLREEYEYLTSEEAIIETIKSNEYTFEANGTLRNK